ncbi:glycosyl hydrolase [Powellomyces hirtus]|nr:glycosyl hydrolase [Powellomyces hirtus]
MFNLSLVMLFGMQLPTFLLPTTIRNPVDYPSLNSALSACTIPSFHNGQVFIHYCASKFGTSKSEIYVATSTTGLAGSWIHQGLATSSARTSGYNAIDSQVLGENGTNGKWYLTSGSFWSSIKQIELDPRASPFLDPNHRDPQTLQMATQLLRLSSSIAAQQRTLLHAGIVRQLLQRCLSTYRIVVGRSTSPTGLFVDKDGVDMMNRGATQIMAGRHPSMVWEANPFYRTATGHDRPPLVPQ